MTTAAPPGPSASPGAQSSGEVARARVAVMVSTYQVDVVLPTKFTIETFIDDLLGVLREAIGEETVDFTPPTGQWSLARPGEPAIPRWRSLADYDISDGAVLALSPVESAEIFTPIVEDITDALALINEREFAEFDANTSAVVGLGTLVVGALALAAMIMAWWADTASIPWCATPALLLGAVCWGGALAAQSKFKTPRVCLGLALAALPLLFVGGGCLVPPAYGVPGPFAAANIAAGAVVAGVAAATMMRLTRLGIATLMASTMVGIIITVAAVPAALFDLTQSQVTTGIVVAGLILLAMSPRMAVLIARIRPPDLPDPGDEVSSTTLTDIFDAETGNTETNPEAESSRKQAEVGIESRARLAVTSLRGLIVAVTGVIAVCAVLSASAHPGGIKEVIVALAVAGVMAMRARWFPDRVQAVSLVAASAVTVIGVGYELTVHYANPVARLIVVLVVALAGVAGCMVAVRLPGVRLAPPTRRTIDLIEYAFIVVIPVLAFWIMGVYGAMRRI